MDSLRNEPLQSRPIRAFYNCCADVVRLAVLCAHDRCLAHSPPASVEFLGAVLVPLPAPDVGFVYFDWTGEHATTAIHCLPQSVS